MDITREPDVGTTRSWLVNTGAATYRATHRPERQSRPMEWTVEVFVQAGLNARKPHWRKIRGLWIIGEIGRHENARALLCNPH